MSQPTGSAPAGEMPGGGGMPGAPAGGPGAYEPQVVSPGVAETTGDEGYDDEEEEPAATGEQQQPQAGGVAPGQPPAQQAAAPAIPPTPQQHEIAQAAQGLYQVAQHVQQTLPRVQTAKQVLEGQIGPYVQNPDLYNQLPPQAQQAVQAGYKQWQALSQEEQRLSGAWQEVEKNTPILQTMWALEQRTAMLNKVGEPVAYQMLARRAAERSGDPNFPIDEMQEFLRGIPPNLLEEQATKYENIYRNARRRERAAGRVDDMGPGSGSTASSRRGPRSGRDMIQDAINSELRQRPARMR